MSKVVNITFSTKFNQPEEEMGMLVKVSYLDKRDRQEILQFSTEVFFLIDDFNNVFEVTEAKEMSIPDLFFLDAITISLGATRGMLALKNEGTYLQHIYLPVFRSLDILNSLKEKIGLPKITV